MNNSKAFINNKHANSIFELKCILECYIKIKSLPKLEREDYIKELEEYEHILAKGIMLPKNKQIQEIITRIVNFLSQYGYNSKRLYSILSNTNFFTTSLLYGYSTNAAAISSLGNIYFDIDIVKFDKNGQFLDFTDNYKDIIIHIIIHELLHTISTYKTNEIVFLSALSEGFTDYIASIISGYKGDKMSKQYEYSRNICHIFSIMLGPVDTLSDYILHLSTYPNLTNLFTNYKLDFNLFTYRFNRLLERRYNKSNIEAILNNEKELLIDLKDNLIIPYIKDNPDKKDVLINTFNELFNTYDVSISYYSYKI